MRVKSQWFKSDRPKTPEEVASAAAFITWRIAHNALKETRKASFEVEIGDQYFDFLSEFLIFLIQANDRILHRQFHWDIRVRFITAMANHLATTFAENKVELMQNHFADTKDGFIQRLNQRAEGYAEHDYGQDQSNFGFLRYLGYCIGSHMNSHDQPWILDQIMSVEAPEALATLERAVKNLLDKACMEDNDSPTPCPE
ncbi:MAG: hypothetical protein G3H99_04655 [Ferrovum sp.]|nr:hypothetical protein [Ferrovum sp.]NDU88020.1 hypothetical protein [Ferrovum sp.]